MNTQQLELLILIIFILVVLYYPVKLITGYYKRKIVRSYMEKQSENYYNSLSFSDRKRIGDSINIQNKKLIKSGDSILDIVSKIKKL